MDEKQWRGRARGWWWEGGREGGGAETLDLFVNAPLIGWRRPTALDHASESKGEDDEISELNSFLRKKNYQLQEEEEEEKEEADEFDFVAANESDPT